MSAEKDILAKEKSFVHYKFKKNLLFPWSTVEITITPKQLQIKENPYFFGIIPAGKLEITYPLRNIASVATSTGSSFFLFLVGLCFLAANAYFIHFGFRDHIMEGILAIVFALPLTLLGIIFLFSSFRCLISITSHTIGLQQKILRLSFREKDKVKEMINKLNEAISEV